ncbi:hypothetical protein [Enterococcus termitis]|uniref:Uncharacterized protein n=1 Tax=Enterococcus termitis TaxID=332950 RepID=A0A1E5H6G9_9ENTE|nr:hypothetical protein [Enterococcus termitis]OEG20446.1 hypothetical protein BCR25_01095 [Enterococcus termitis]OJH00007.1 hypothetical protein RV18_GL000345 [Enterococcus termitis]
MKMVIWRSFYYGKKIFIWLIYLLFAFYIYSLVLSSEALGARLFFGCIGVAVLGIVCLFEYLKILYDQMIYALNVSCDLKKAVQIKEHLKKKDLFNGFKQSIIIFDSLLLLDTGNYTDCLDHLHKHRKFFHGTLDYLFIYYHTQMYCYYFLKDEKNLTITLEKLFQLKNGQKKQPQGLFSWHEISGMRYFHQKRNQKCLQELALIDTARLNNRELTYLLHLKGQCLLELNQQTEGHRLLKQARAIGNTLAVVQVI